MYDYAIGAPDLRSSVSSVLEEATVFKKIYDKIKSENGIECPFCEQ